MNSSFFNNIPEKSQMCLIIAYSIRQFLRHYYPYKILQINLSKK